MCSWLLNMNLISRRVITTNAVSQLAPFQSIIHGRFQVGTRYNTTFASKRIHKELSLKCIVVGENPDIHIHQGVTHKKDQVRISHIVL